MDSQSQLEVPATLCEDTKEIREAFFPDLAPQDPYDQRLLQVRVASVGAVLDVLRGKLRDALQPTLEGLPVGADNDRVLNVA